MKLITALQVLCMMLSEPDATACMPGETPIAMPAQRFDGPPPPWSAPEPGPGRVVSSDDMLARRIILVLMTIVNCIMCALNYNKGLKPYVMRRKVDSEDEKMGPGPMGSAYAPYATEMQPNAGGYGMQGAAVGKMAPPRPMPARMEID